MKLFWTRRKKLTNRLFEVFVTALKLGLTSFGGPVAHLGYFHQEYVERRKWLEEGAFTDLVGLCQFLPGPASSQLGIAIGTLRAGWAGGLLAWLGFTLPSAVLMTGFSLLLSSFDFTSSGWIHGLKLVAVVVVAQAVLLMGQRLITNTVLLFFSVAALAASILWPTALTQILVIAAAGGLGLVFGPRPKVLPAATPPGLGRQSGAVYLLVFFLLLFILPLLAQTVHLQWLSVFDSLYRSGSLVFGGGHVVLPLLEKEFVPGWISRETFLAGYGAAQAVPGPLFTFSAFLGAQLGGVGGAVLGLVALFLPAWLLIMGALPFWAVLRVRPRLQGALSAISAAVVGLLLSALYDPLWLSSVTNLSDIVLVAALFGLLVGAKLPPWFIALLGALVGQISGWYQWDRFTLFFH